jgi:site-specific DNA recombinase
MDDQEQHGGQIAQGGQPPDRAQATLAANRRIAKNTHRRYLMRGVIRRGICGLTYLGSRGRDDIGWYRCGGQLVERGPIRGRCWGQSIRADAIESVIWADIEHWLRVPGEVLEELDGRAEREAQGAVAVAESVTLASALEALERQRKQALALSIRGSMTDAELDAELSRIAVEKAALEARVAAMAAPQAPDVSEATIDLLGDLRTRLDAGLSDEQRREIVGLLARVVVHTETSGESGRKTARAAVEYRFPAVVQTSTVIRVAPATIRPADAGSAQDPAVGQGAASGRRAARPPRCPAAPVRPCGPSPG